MVFPFEELNDFTNLIVLSALFPLITFIYRYVMYSPFQVTVLGKNYLVQKIAFTAVMLLVLIGLFIPELFLREWFRLIIYAAVVTTFWVDLVSLLRVQKKHPFRQPKGWLKELFSRKGPKAKV